MTNFADLYPGEKMTVRIDHAATVTARMPTSEECAGGFPPGAPLLVVSGGGLGDKVFSQMVELTFDDPHGAPEPGAVRDAALYVLGTAREELNLAVARVNDLIGAARRSPCSILHLADEVRAERDEEGQCADAGLCAQSRALGS